MKRALLLAALVFAGCDNSNGPSAPTPIDQNAQVQRPPGPPIPVVKPRLPLANPPPVAPEPPPSGPAGLTRSKLGDTVEFSWSKVDSLKMSPAETMVSAIKNGGKPDPKGKGAPKEELPEGLHMPEPTPMMKSGTLTIVRVEPESPFTFRVDVKSGKESSSQLYAYAPDIALHKVMYRSDEEAALHDVKAAGKTFKCFETPTRQVAPDADELALSGGLVTESLLDKTRVGAVSVSLTRVGNARVKVGTDKVKKLDTFETPLAIAMEQASQLGFVDPEVKAARDAALKEALTTHATGCISNLKPARGVLDAIIAKGKLEALVWNAKPAPKPFDKCLRAKAKALDWPEGDVSIKVTLGQTP